MNNVFKRLFKSSIQTRLGRWSITKNHDEAKRKIDLANYDHCGTCPTIPKVKSDNFDNSMDVVQNTRSQQIRWIQLDSRQGPDSLQCVFYYL